MARKHGKRYLQLTLYRDPEHGSNRLTQLEVEHRKELQRKLPIPPFSVLDARAEKWQARKEAWLALGIQSELGRSENLQGMSNTVLQPKDVKRQIVAQLGPEAKRLGLARLTDPLVQRRLLALLRTHHDLGVDLGRRGVPVNVEAVIPGFYTKRRLGVPRAKIILDWLLSGSTKGAGTSIFDPVLCECIYSWFCPPGGRILDPFAGGSVRGIIAARLGRQYTGVDLSAAQVEANRRQAKAILKPGEPEPQWIVGDSRELDTLLPEFDADLVFTCPPYYNLEVYSDNPADLSKAKSYREFCEALKTILHLALARLKPHRFACVVISNVRQESGKYRRLVSETETICEEGGADLYNDAVLVTTTGSLGMRAVGMFNSTRKLAKVHQNVLFFCKGDPKKATQAIQPAGTAPDGPGEQGPPGDWLTVPHGACPGASSAETVIPTFSALNSTSERWRKRRWIWEAFLALGRPESPARPATGHRKRPKD